MERFGMDNDYDDGQWIGGEYYGKRRQKWTQTKDDVLYGVFAFDNSDSDYEGSGSKKRRKDSGKRTDFTKPVNFVSTGSVIPNQEIDQNTKEKTLLAKKSSHSGKKDLDLAGVGSFEKDIKGIGWILLEKMGYKGCGLDKNAQGIVAPIEAKQHPKSMGMGFNDYKEAVRPALPDLDEKPLTMTNQTSEVCSKEKLWSKQAQKENAYITAEELLTQKQERGLEVVEKIFDMRGSQVRVLTNLENLNAKEKGRENDVPMTEVQHNVRLMVDLVELDIQKLDTKVRNERETVVALQKEKEKLQKEAHQQKQQLENMEEIMCTGANRA